MHWKTTIRNVMGLLLLMAYELVDVDFLFKHPEENADAWRGRKSLLPESLINFLEMNMKSKCLGQSTIFPMC
jgi:hypothetical protein